jgi:N-acetylglucosaminyldiphosphoundecaprenol N-acetyl-beta-D-mannosaminyltransferase
VKSVLVEKIIATEQWGDRDFLKEKRRIYTFLNLVSYLDALQHQDMFAQFDGIFADGSLLVKAIRLLYGKHITRRSFDMTSLAPRVLEYARTNKKSIYIVASKQEQVEEAVSIFQKNHPEINIVGYRNGYFADEKERDMEAKHIVALNPDFLIVGMKTIIQEEFLLKVKGAGYQGIGFTCGGFIHQTAKNGKDFYPAWVDRMNLRFLYRMWREPHTRKRYLVAGIVFPARFIWERFFE